jgi:flagellar basal-body rod protein FlgB
MSFDLNSYLGIHTQALSLRTQRMTLLSENLSNADTPNYKARDFDFRTVLARAADPTHAITPALARTNPAHLPAGGAAGEGVAQVKYRIPNAPALDGNTVESDVELAEIGENALRYQATLTFLGDKLATLKSAITGE